MNLFLECVCTIIKLLTSIHTVFSGVLKLRQHKCDKCDLFSGELVTEGFSSFPHLSPSNSLTVGKKGFTLIEVMMVVAILGTLAAIAIPNFISYRERARYVDTIQTMRIMERELTIFNMDNGRFPNSLAEAGLGNLRDPWGNPFQYLNIETSRGNGKRRKNRNLVPINQDFDLYSMGPDGRSVSPLTAKHSRDDIVRANNGAFLGRASNY